MIRFLTIFFKYTMICYSLRHLLQICQTLIKGCCLFMLIIKTWKLSSHRLIDDCMEKFRTPGEIHGRKRGRFITDHVNSRNENKSFCKYVFIIDQFSGMTTSTLRGRYCLESGGQRISGRLIQENTLLQMTVQEYITR